MAMQQNESYQPSFYVPTEATVNDLMTDPQVEVTRGFKTKNNMEQIRSIPMHAIILYKPHQIDDDTPQQFNVINQIGPKMFECDGKTIVGVNAELYAGYAEYIKYQHEQLQHRHVDPLTSDDALKELYNDRHIRHGLHIASQWKVAGHNRTPPDTENTKIRSSQLRFMVTGLRGVEDCENLWGDNMYSQNSCFLFIKFVQVKERVKTFLIAGHEKKTIEWPFVIDGHKKHYVPQFVAVQTPNTVSCPIDICTFNIEKTISGVYKQRTYCGIPYYIGRCDINYTKQKYPSILLPSEMPIDNALDIAKRPVCRIFFHIH